MDKIIPYILATLTKEKRYKPEIKWSSNSWTHNIFRVYEMIFWKKYSPKLEAMSETDYNGNTTNYSFTLENALATFEHKIRTFQLPKFKVVKVAIPQYAIVGLPQKQSVYRFAIAFGAVAEVGYSTAATKTTGSITVSGSDTLGIGVFHDQANGSTITAATFNSASMTVVNSQAQGGGQGNDYVYAIVAPSTGVVSATRGTNSNSFSVSGLFYSGCNQSTTLDNTNKSGGSGGATVTTSITPVASNCWVLSTFHNDSGNVSLNSGGTLRGSVQATVSGQADSNGTVTGGAQYDIIWNSFNNPGVAWSWITISIAPPITTAIKTIDGLAKASVKTVDGLAIASVKTWNGLA